MLKRFRPSLFIKKSTNFAAKCLTCLDKAFSTENINDNIRHTMRKYLFIFAMLLCWGHTTTAQTTDNLLNIAGLEPDLSGKTTYYLKNVGTGLYMSYGGEHGTHCIETHQAHPIIVEENGDYVAIASIGGYLESNTLWMDWAMENSKWKLVPVEGYTNQYYLIGDGNRALTSVGNSAGLLNLRDLTNVAVQRWVFVNGQDIKKNKMPEATVDNPFDVTVAIRGGAFDLVDVWEPAPYTPEILKSYMPYGQKWINVLTSENTESGVGYASDRYGTGIGHGEWDANLYNYCALIWGEGGAVERDVTYSMTLPKGTYHYSFEGFYVGIKHVKVQKQTRTSRNGSWNNEGDPTETDTYDAEVPVTVSFEGTGLSGVQESLPSYGGQTMWNNGAAAAAEFRDNDNHKLSGTFYLSQETEVSIVIRKGTVASSEDIVVTGQGGTFIKYDNARTVTTTSLANSQIFIDEFALLYLGEDEVDEANIDPNATYKNYINANVEEYKATLNEEGKAAFDEVFASVDVDNIKNRADYYNVIAAMESANNAGIVAHLKAEILKDAIATGDFTKVITNNSFETGDLTGWTLGYYSADTGVKSNSIATYQTQGVDGSYLFNTWWQGTPITQTITGLPNGVYKMSVLIASGDDGNDASVYLLGNEEKKGVNPPSRGKEFGDFSLKFTVTNGTATIGVVGGADDDTAENPVGSYVEGGHWWYKADNFRLEYLGEDHLELDETASAIENINEPYKKVTINRTIKPNTWSTFVVPFDIPASFLADWEVKELSGSTYDEENDHISLTFADATDGIKAGVPYMVRNTTMTSNLESLSMEDVVVNTQLKNASTEHVEFIGVYTNGYVPQGAFFISDNTFYCSAEDNSNTMKAFRAYLQPTVPIARSLSYRTDGETTAIDNSQLANDNEATVVAIYNLQGVRLDDMQEGVNILQMSNGSVVKVIIK